MNVKCEVCSHVAVHDGTLCVDCARVLASGIAYTYGSATSATKAIHHKSMCIASNPTSQQLQQAYKAGLSSAGMFADGGRVRRMVNPYDPNDARYVAWLRGYQDGHS